MERENSRQPISLQKKTMRKLYIFNDKKRQTRIDFDETMRM
jgi:hypothetical protein